MECARHTDSINTMLTAAAFEFVAVVLIEFSGLSVPNGFGQQIFRINAFEKVRTEIQQLTLIGIIPVNFDVMGLGRVHDHQVTALQRVGTALDVKDALSADKIVDFGGGVGVHRKIIRVGVGVQPVGQMEIPVGILIQCTHKIT